MTTREKRLNPDLSTQPGYVSGKIVCAYVLLYAPFCVI